MNSHDAYRKIIRGWLVRRETDEQMQRVVNAFFFGRNERAFI
jgi:hypothetical protein